MQTIALVLIYSGCFFTLLTFYTLHNSKLQQYVSWIVTIRIVYSSTKMKTKMSFRVSITLMSNIMYNNAMGEYFSR